MHLKCINCSDMYAGQVAPLHVDQEGWDCTSHLISYQDKVVGALRTQYAAVRILNIEVNNLCIIECSYAHLSNVTDLLKKNYDLYRAGFLL